MVRSKSPAGIEPRLDREASTLAAAGHEVHVLLWDRKLEYPEIESRGGYMIHRYRRPAPEGQFKLLPRMPGWRLWEVRTLMRLQPDAVHACDFDTALPALSYARLRRIRFVYEIFDFYAYMIAQPIGPGLRELLAGFERSIARRADVVIIVDKGRASQLGAGFPGRVVEIMNVPAEVSISEPEEKEFTVFYGGMISWERGLEQLVEATAMAGVRLVVAGHGADEARLVPLFKRSANVSYLGNISYQDVLKWSARSHVIAALYDPQIPNNRLASPNKLFEAMMLRKPVLTNRGIRPAEVVNEVGCGVVVEYGDARGTADALRRLASDAPSRREMGMKGRKAFEGAYNWKIMANRLIETYASLAKPSPLPAA